eukprot:scaffold2127_cov85-Cylindrotheca_fusiformis.AAC.3
MDAGKQGHMVHRRDSFGCTPMDYLCLNRMMNSTEVVDKALAAVWAYRKTEIGRVVKVDEATSKKLKLGEATSQKEQILADRQRCRVNFCCDNPCPSFSRFYFVRLLIFLMLYLTITPAVLQLSSCSLIVSIQLYKRGYFVAPH